MTSAEAPPPPRPSSSLSPRTRITLIVWVVALSAITVWRLGCAPIHQTEWEFTGATMGTTWSVKVSEVDLGTEARAAIADAISARLDVVNAQMSNWDPQSEISRFNAHASTDPFPVSPPVIEVLTLSREVSRRSEGAFDVTVAPLVAAWGFGPVDRPPEAPAPERLADLLEQVGWRGIEVAATSNTLRKRDPRLTADLSAVAKGHGVDAIAEAVAALGHGSFLAEIGGELRAAGLKASVEPWRVAIEAPDTEVRTIWEAIELRDAAMATSGDYRNYYERDGQRISHTIDPRTGRPIEHALASVSVVAETAARADAWATALNVLGPEGGPALAEREGLAAYFIVRDPESESGFRSVETPPFTALRTGAAD